MNMKLLPIISIQYSANREWDYLNLSGGSCYLDVAPNSYNLFTGKCVAARGENLKGDLGSRMVKIWYLFSRYASYNV